MPVLGVGRLQGWFPLTGLPWNLHAVPGIFAGQPPTFDGTSSQAHQLGMNLNPDNRGSTVLQKPIELSMT